ncbi:molecular chaperone [Kosakonia radicincitans]|nr:molecular chaperone [Kosakonia radicincitans]MDD7995986.1 molecular chaperone [Kosakonia radicincitans]
MLTMLKISAYALSLIFCCASAQAGVVLGGTRIIYEEGKKEVSIDIENKGSVPYLIQSWVENQDGVKTSDFLVTPPLFRLDGDKKNALRIFKLVKELPVDRESLFFLNAKSIPGGMPDSNTLQIAIRNRLKLIYRPTALKKETPENRTEELIWSRTGNKLKVTNPGPYYQNFMFIKINDKDIELKDKNYAAPFTDTWFDIGAINGNQISWKIINDYGSAGPLHRKNL